MKSFLHRCIACATAAAALAPLGCSLSENGTEDPEQLSSVSAAVTDSEQLNQIKSATKGAVDGLGKIPALGAGVGAYKAFVDAVIVVFEMFEDAPPTLSVPSLYDLVGSLSWQVNRTAVDTQWGNAVAATEAVKLLLEDGRSIDPGSAAYIDSAEAVNYMEQQSAYQRVSTPMPDGLRIAVGDPPTSGGLQYDWRLAVPGLLKMLPMRMAVIAAYDPSFQTDGRFTEELTRHRDALAFHYDQIRQGIKCGMVPAHEAPNTGDFDTYYCVDKWTGQYDRLFDALLRTRQYSYADAEAGAKAMMYANRPLFELRRAIDMLNKMLSPGNVQLVSGSLRSSRGNVCVDVQWGGTEVGTPVWAYECNGSPAQQWTWDKGTGLLKNEASGRCLQAVWLAPKALRINTCGAGSELSWSQNTVTGVWENANGYVIDLPRGRAENENVLQGLFPNGARAQRWVPVCDGDGCR